MATRDENLKKINDDLELMSDAELDQVAGGTYNNTAADTRILHDMGFNISGRSASSLFWSQSDFDDAAADVNKIMGQFGIHVDQSWGCKDNKYYQGPNEISRYQAFMTIAKATGKDMPDIDY